MASSLFGNSQIPQMPTQQPNNPLQMLAKFREFAQQMRGKNPEAMIQNLMNSGQMNDAQFQQLVEQAKQVAPILKSMMK